ncbi:MAG: hypothetical protein ACIAQZ_12245 [Sedimentisphaeraceae bacterium JB056]
MTILIQILVAVLQAILPAMINRKDSFEDAKKQTDLKKKLNQRIDQNWGKVALPLLVCVFLAGCVSTKTVYITSGEPVRIRETIKNAKVWTLDADGNPVAGKIDIPAGWYALPFTEEDN